MNALLFGSVFACLAAAPSEDHETIVVRLQSGPFTTLHYGGDVRVPYLWPVISPGGAEMTRAFPMERGRPGETDDHPHHTSMWFAHGNVNGHDFWHSKGATPRIEIVEKPALTTSAHTVMIDTVQDWIDADDEKLIRDTRRMVFAESDGVRHIDVDIQLKALVDLTFGDTKEGSFALRLHPALRLKGEVATGHALNSEGDVDGELWGKRAGWLTYFGTVDEHEVGIAIFDHPDNLRYPTWWHARTYGLVAANPFGIHDFESKAPGTGDYELPKGEVLHLRYRVLLYVGAPDQEVIGKSWLDWAGPAGQLPTAAGKAAGADK